MTDAELNRSVGKGAAESSADTVTETGADELTQPRAQRDSARAAVSRRELGAKRGGPARRLLVFLLVALFALLLPLTVTFSWVHRTVLDTNTWVDTVAPIAADPAVTAAVSNRLTDQLYATLDPQQRIAAALPPKAAFLAAPITNGTKDYVRQAVNNVLNSQQFQTLWREANRFAHAQLVAALRHDTKVLDQTGGTVVLNLAPMLNDALANLGDFTSNVVGRQVTLPTVGNNEAPAVTCAKISAALDRPVAPTCGQIPLFSAKKLHMAQRYVKAFDRGVLALLIITPLAAAAALAVSRRRRRTLLQLTIAGMLGLVIVRRALMWLQSDLISTGRPENKDARAAITHGVLGGFFDLTAWFLIGGAVIVAIALITGPYRWAVATRRAVSHGTRRGVAVVRVAASGAAGRSPDDASVAWVRSHIDALRIAAVGVAILLLLTISVNFWGFVVIAGLLALFMLGLHRLRPPASVTLPPD